MTVVLRLPKPVGLRGIMNEAMDVSFSLIRPVTTKGARFSGYATPSYKQVALPPVLDVSKPRIISNSGPRTRHYLAWYFDRLTQRGAFRPGRTYSFQAVRSC